MAIPVFLMEALNDAGKGVEDMIVVARAMQRGPDASEIYALFDSLMDADCPTPAIAIAVCELAAKINELNTRPPLWVARVRDAHTEAKDSNRSRRGMPDNQWRALRTVIFERDNHTCQYCGSGEDLTCDHIVPLVRGGTNLSDNLTTACRSCNSSKADKLVDEWRSAWA